jgi:hypothetical protein
MAMERLHKDADSLFSQLRLEMVTAKDLAKPASLKTKT